MKYIFLIGLVISVLYFVFKGDQYINNKTFDGNIDLQKYSGQWYQILEAKNNNANIFSLVEGSTKTCFSVKVDYTVVDGDIQLKNTCNSGGFDGREVTIYGIAKPINPQNTKLKVRFDPWYLKPFLFDYWIVYIDDDYQIAVLSSPKSNGVTILSREKNPDKELYQIATKKAEELGYDFKNTEKTPQ